MWSDLKVIAMRIDYLKLVVNALDPKLNFLVLPVEFFVRLKSN